MDALVELINDIKAARDAGRTDAAVGTAQDFQRRAQFYVDFIESENSTGFHHLKKPHASSANRLISPAKASLPFAVHCRAGPPWPPGVESISLPSE